MPVLEVDEHNILGGLAMMFLEPARCQGVHIVFHGQTPSAGHVDQRVERSDVFVGQRRREENTPRGRIDKTGGTEPDEVSLVIGKLLKKTLRDGYRLGGSSNRLEVDLPQGLAAQIQAAGLYVTRPDGDSDNVQSAGIDGDRNSRASGPAGFGRLFAEEALLQEFGHMGTDGVGDEAWLVDGVASAERSLATQNSQNFALLKGRTGCLLLSMIENELCGPW